LNWQKQINEPKPHIFEQYRLFEQEIEKFDDMTKLLRVFLKILFYGTQIGVSSIRDYNPQVDEDMYVSLLFLLLMDW
jgi:hypothetical protein